MMTNQGYFLRLNVSLRWPRKGARSTKQRKEEKVLYQPNNEKRRRCLINQTTSL